MRFLGLIAITLLFAGLSAAQTYQQGTVLDIQAKGARSAVHKATDAPPPADVAAYDVTVRIGDRVYVGRYEHASNYVPGNWQVGKPVEVRVGKHKHRIYLKNVAGKEVALAIVTRHPAQSPQTGK
jgi:hypothetical protein